jgi:benzoyl-CoA reductase/2-hydroxyglutaryl-CoA dehydratase subunit BcrC/BadD/HgdB
MEDIKTLAEEIQNQYVKKWRDEGGKILGFSCVATPVEIIEAAGILPYRIKAMGSAEKEMADAYMSRFNCGFCRSCLQLGLDGTYDFLDGLIETNGCDHLRGMFENWELAKKPAFFHYLRVPHFVRGDSLAAYEEELGLLRDALAEHYAVTIDDEALNAAIATSQDIMGMLRSMNEMRERGEPAITGAEALAMVALSSSMPAQAFKALLEGFLEERSEAKVGGFRARLMLGGAATDELYFVEEIESLGGMVVADTLCYGSRALWRLPDTDGGPLHQLAEGYLRNLNCPRMFKHYEQRRDFVLGTAKKAEVDGAVLIHNKFCDLHAVDNVALRADLESEGVPVLLLEKDYGAKADIGRIKTRVQAFLERIEG